MSETLRRGRCRLVLAEDGRSGALVALGCSTRFVAASEPFEELLAALPRLVLEGAPADTEALLELPWPGGGSVRGALTATSLQLQESVAVTGLHRLEAPGGFVGGYVHHTEELGVLASLSTAAALDDARTFLRQLGMHVAAFPPVVLRREEFAPDRIQYEVGGFDLEVQGEAPGMREAWVQSRLARFYAESCLVDQRWVLDEGLTVAEAAVAALGEGTEVLEFARLQVGG